MIKKRLKCAKNTNKIRKNSGMKFKKMRKKKGDKMDLKNMNKL